MSSLAVVLISFSIAFCYGVVCGGIWDASRLFRWFRTTKGSLIQLGLFLGSALVVVRLLASLIELVTGCTCLTRQMQLGIILGIMTGFIAEEVIVALAKRGILRVSKDMPF